jgi:hypothetical protein
MSLRELNIRLRGHYYLCLSTTIVALRAVRYKSDEATTMLDTRPRTIFDFEAITNPTSGMQRTSPLASRVTSLVLQRPGTRTFGLLVPTAMTYVRLFLNCILSFLPIKLRCTQSASQLPRDRLKIRANATSTTPTILADQPTIGTSNGFPPRRFRRTMTPRCRNLMV